MSEAFSLAEARLLWEKAVRHLKAARNLGPNPPNRFVKAVFQASSLVLAAYSHPANWIEGTPKEHIPRELARAIVHHIDMIVAGKVPDSIQDCIAAHRTSVGPQELHDIQWAVLYLKAVKKGLIQDRAPIKTVAKAFGVVDRTVKAWNSKHKSLNLDVGLRYVPQAEAPSQHVTKEMRKAADRYRVRGRSSTAIRSRNTKRRLGG
jgi:hypothetical protein